MLVLTEFVQPMRGMIDTEVQGRCPFSSRRENVARGDALRASKW